MNARRHDWVFLPADAVAVADGAEGVTRAWLGRWLAAGRPLVVTRQPGQGATLALGAQLPRAEGGRRIACTAPVAAVTGLRQPVTVEEAADVLPAAHARALRRFASALAGHVLQVGVYGSTAWDYFGAGGYRHAESDIDVICDVASGAGLSACLAAFAGSARHFPARLDGEIRLPHGRAVAWRELHDACAGGSPVVLAKGERDIALLALRHVLEPLR